MEDALCHAASKGLVDEVKTLISNNANPNRSVRNGITPIMIACIKGHLEVVLVLLEYGSNINQVANDGNSCLSLACRSGHMGIITALLEHNADVNLIRNDGCSPLFIACRYGNLEMVEKLLLHGAKVDAATNGITPLIMVCVYGKFEVCKLLILHGADPTLKGSHELNAIQVAMLKQHSKIAKWLQVIYGYSQLHIAIDIQHCDTIKRLLSNKSVDVRDTTFNAKSPLDFAQAKKSHCNLPASTEIMWLIENALGPWSPSIDQSDWPENWRNCALALLSVSRHYQNRSQRYNTRSKTVLSQLPKDIFLVVLSYTSRSWFIVEDQSVS